MNENKFIRIETVLERTGVSKAFLYSLIRRGEFPAPTRIAPRCARWIESQVNEWIENRESVAKPARASASKVGTQTGERLMRIGPVSKATGLSTTKIRNMIERGKFPVPKKIGERYEGWAEADISAWIDQNGDSAEPPKAAQKARVTVVMDMALSADIAEYRERLYIATGLRVSESQAICGLARLGLMAAKGIK